MAGRVIFDENRCKGCELCTTACPMNIVAMDKEKINNKGYHPAGVKEMENAQVVRPAQRFAQMLLLKWKEIR
jgi:Fe-S-cluster-containing hydrogenase component 2